MIHESDIASEDRTNNCPRWGGFVVSVMQKTKSHMYLYWVELFTVTANLYNIAFLHTLNKLYFCPRTLAQVLASLYLVIVTLATI